MVGRTRHAASVSLRFPPAKRMRRPREFQRVYAGGMRVGNEYFTVNAQANGLTCARLGMSVAARMLRQAVARNRVRRLIRESFRVNQVNLPPLDIIVGVRTAVRAADNAQLRAGLAQIWLKVTALCA